MNNCPKCQSENLQHTRYCTTCGYDYAPKRAEQVTCPTCKQNYPADTQFCMIDGTRLTKPFQEFKPTYDAPPPNYASLNDPAILDEPVPAFPRRAYPQQVYPKASLGDRFVAMLLDGLIAIGLALPAIGFIFMGAFMMETKKSEQNAILLMGFGFLLTILPFGYMFIKDGLNQGQSYGKRAMNLMVVELDGYRPCSKTKSFVRRLISTFVSLIPLVGSFIEPIMVLVTDDGRKLGDKAANTQVVEVRDFYE